MVEVEPQFASDYDDRPHPDPRMIDLLAGDLYTVSIYKKNRK